MLKAAVPFHDLRERSFPRMPERPVAKIMRQRNGLNQILIKTQNPANRSSYLGNFKRVGEAGAVMVALMVDKHLRLVLQAAESRGMENSVPVPLKSSAEFVLFFRIFAAFAKTGFHRIRGQGLDFPLFEIAPSYHARGLTALYLSWTVLPALFLFPGK